MASSDNTDAALAVATNILANTTLNATSKPDRDFDKNPLTYGIEYEFIVKATIKDDDWTMPYPSNPLALLKIDHNDVNAEKLVAQFEYEAKQNYAAPTYVYILHKTIDHVLGKNVRVLNPDWDSNVSKGWFDKNDTSLMYPGATKEETWETLVEHDKKFFYYGVEVVSPILPATDKGFDEAKKVADLLNSELRSFVNRSCGLHVHVGDGKNGFTLDTLKNVIGLLWIFDREIIRLHPKFRKSLSGSAYCPSFVAQILGRWPDAGAIKAKLLELYTATTPLEINCMLGHKGRYSAYNFENLSSFVNLTDEMKARKKSFHETIEFRQHEATLNGDRAKHWAKFCVAIVEYAMNTGKDEMLKALLQEHNEQQMGDGTTIWELAQNLGLDVTAAFYKDFVEEKESLRASKYRLKVDHKLPVAKAELTNSLRARHEDRDKTLQAAKRDLEEAEQDLALLFENHYAKGANRPDDIIKYDSDNESEYGEEIAYYGKAGVKPENAEKEKCFGQGECDAETEAHTQFCQRCRPGYVPPTAPTAEPVVEGPLPAGWAEEVPNTYSGTNWGEWAAAEGWGDENQATTSASASAHGTSATEESSDEDAFDTSATASVEGALIAKGKGAEKQVTLASDDAWEL